MNSLHETKRPSMLQCSDHSFKPQLKPSCIASVDMQVKEKMFCISKLYHLLVGTHYMILAISHFA